MRRLKQSVAGALLAAGCAAGCGGAPDPPDRPFAAQGLVQGSHGAVVAAGVDGKCGALVVRAVRGGRTRSAVRLTGDELGFKCPNRVVAMGRGAHGIDVTVQGTDDDGSFSDNTERQEWDVLRLTHAGARSNAFGGDGLARDVPSESMVPGPAGTLIGPRGERVDADGKLEDRDPLDDSKRSPVELVPGSEVLAAAPRGGSFVAGQPRKLEDRTGMLVARLSGPVRLDTSWGRGGQTTVRRLGEPSDVLPLAGGGVWVADFYGGVARLDDRGRVAGGPVLPFGTPTQGPGTPSPDVHQSVTADSRGGLVVGRSIGDGQVGVLRVAPGGGADRAFRPRPIRLPDGARGVSSVEVAPASGGGVLVLVDPKGARAPFVVALDRGGRRGRKVTLRG